MTRRIMVTHNGTEYSGEVMTITSTALGTEDHGLFVAAVTLEGNGTGVTFGDYALDGKPDPATHERTSTAYGLDYIRKIMWVVGVDRWERLKGMRVVTLYLERLRSRMAGDAITWAGHR